MVARRSGEGEFVYVALRSFLFALPVLALACVIDRHGYDARYRAKYGCDQWKLCRTAFAIAVERAAKHARSQGRRLAVYPEKCSRKDDKRIRSHFEELRERGQPFDQGNSLGYAPLTATEFAETLIGIEFKAKSSPLVQIADLYLYPLARHRYGNYAPSVEMHEHGKVLDCVLTPEQCAERGVKYSCFELVQKQQRPEPVKSEPLVGPRTA